MNRLLQLWRTSTVRLTATFILIFVVFAVLLLGLVWYQVSIQIQRQQADEIDREVAAISRMDTNQGFRAVIFTVDRLARQPGPGLYYLADPVGQRIAGNVDSLPLEVLQMPGVYSFDYEVVQADDASDEAAQGTAVVRSLVLPSGLLLVVGRDVVERRGFTALIFGGFVWGVAGILVFSLVAGLVTSLRVLRRIDSISSTADEIIGGNLSERIPVTRRNDEFDRLATSLNVMLDRIERLLRGLKEVTDNVAHDLKTPLTRIRSRAEAALRDGRSEAERRDALETTLTESDRLIRTFNALLMIAKAEAGAPAGALSPVDVSAVAGDVAELYAPVAEEAGMNIETAIEPGITMAGNRELLGQALVNLIENALKYAGLKSDEGRIGISLTHSPGRVRIEVADNGRGIPEPDRERVLQRFVRLEPSRTEEGSGLGLSLVAAVTRLHGGSLRLEDNAPGLRAIMDLPAA